MTVIAAVLCILLCILINHNQATSRYKTCWNPNQKKGLCAPIFLCLPLNSVLVKSKLTDSEIEFVRNSRCESDQSKPYYICCTTDTDYNRTPDEIHREDSSSLPDRSICGHSSAHTKFLWLAVLEYRMPSGQIENNLCTGSLINHRYVLTAALCLAKSYSTLYADLVSVILGEHDTSAVDCRNGRCQPDPVRVAVEEIRIHENFILGLSKYDIGLIRLQTEVAYTPSIQPICLPSTVGVQHWKSRQEFTGAGWGANHTQIGSLVQMKFEVARLDLDSCRPVFPTWNTLGESHLCTNGTAGCKRIIGGPLMAYHEGVWVLGGIVSFGVICRRGNIPNFYTNVISYESWIKQTIRP